jgi:ABC-type glycerol-3-phosphate transport system permease component
MRSQAAGKRTLQISLDGVIKHLLMLAMTVAILYPMYFMVSSAFKVKIEYLNNKLGLPIEPVLENFRHIFFQLAFPQWFLNSVILTAGSLLVTTVLACLAAYAFSHMRFVGRDTLFDIIIALMVIPPVVMVIPVFSVMTRLQLVDTYPAPIITYTGLLLPFSIYLLRNFFKTIPKQIIESARIDGCTDWLVLQKIIMPLSAPALITLLLVNALWVWNELLIALILLQSEKMRSLMVGLTLIKGRFTVNQPLIMAGMLSAALPMLILYLIGQRYFIKGLAAGAVTGE